MLIRAGGDHTKIEKTLALDKGALANGDAVVAIVSANNAPNARIPSGNERGANNDWKVGGYTKLGIPEAVVDLKNKPFTLANLSTILRWVETKKFKTAKPTLSKEEIEELKKWIKNSK